MTVTGAGLSSGKSKQISTPPGKVLVVQTAFIGDVVFASPLVHAVKRAYPQAEVSLLVRPSSQEVARCIPGVDDVLTFDKRGDESGPLGVLRAARRIRSQEFDLLISPHRSARTALLAWTSGIPLRVGYRGFWGKMAYHVAFRPKKGELCTLANDVAMLEQVGIHPAGTTLRLSEPTEKHGYVEAFLERHKLSPSSRLVALCIGAFWPTKRWPAVYFASLAESLLERGYHPVLLGGPDERSIATSVAEALHAPLLSVVGNSLLESAALLRRCTMSVGGDSGLTHMARALGVPTVLIFGPTDHRVHTFGEKTKVLTAKIKCRPCSSHGPRRCPKRHHDCIRLVSPERVLDALAEITSLQASKPRNGRQAVREDPTPTPVSPVTKGAVPI